MLEESERRKRSELLRKVLSDLSVRGYSIISLNELAPPTSEEVLEHADDLLGMLGQLIPVFSTHQAWRPLRVRLDREPGRSEGIGYSPLHMDFVNAENPPDYVALYCARSDPHEGGVTLLAPNMAVDLLPSEVLRILSRPVYADGQVVDLLNVGQDINPFAILCSESNWRFRYTGNLLMTCFESSAKMAVTKLDSVLRAHLAAKRLEPGEMVIIDQHKVVHGKGPLGAGQANIPEPARRLLWQRFIRAT